MPTPRFSTFEQLWRYYLAEHQDPCCRMMHDLGIVAGVGGVALAIATHHWWLLPGSVAVAYVMAWIGHAVFERNVPATFQFAPWDITAHGWLLRAQLRMFFAGRKRGRRRSVV